MIYDIIVIWGNNVYWRVAKLCWKDIKSHSTSFPKVHFLDKLVKDSVRGRKLSAFPIDHIANRTNEQILLYCRATLTEICKPKSTNLPLSLFTDWEVREDFFSSFFLCLLCSYRNIYTSTFDCSLGSISPPPPSPPVSQGHFHILLQKS